MPYIHIQITDENVSTEQKKQLIAGATDLMVKVLNKKPEKTFVLIEEVSLDNWGIGYHSVRELRQLES
ncbi:4-oxalocrotonate tautomerase family protein [Rheinheimera mesophila]|uniref:Tautomerase n=1 Tax=Rheinheimera mesophila TaxID=1547515 RepID=A0A3P3QJR7_9GAMM|nr:4-oxalocrotonate tautomerase family protein [Rheinheimera mesophila]KKL02493.1 hypothetical protein SD53_04465 [Rheinheimera mesophila]RRJ21318.1 4-oxalocrotonate tautomerase family protein [Rheinheimera mesophila]